MDVCFFHIEDIDRRFRDDSAIEREGEESKKVTMSGCPCVTNIHYGKKNTSDKYMKEYFPLKIFARGKSVPRIPSRVGWSKSAEVFL